jgi:hypothetical protein
MLKLLTASALDVIPKDLIKNTIKSPVVAKVNNIYK